MFCSNCGFNIAGDGQKFCPNCGNPIGQIPQQTMPQPTQQFAQPAMQQPVQQFARPMMPQPTQQFAQPMMQQPAQQFAQPMMQQPTQQFAQPMMQQPTQQFAQPMMQQPAQQFAQPMMQQPTQQFAQPMMQQPTQQFAQPTMQRFAPPAPKKPMSPETIKLICKISSFVCLGLILLFTMLNVGGHYNGFSTFGNFFKNYAPLNFFWQLWFVGTIIVVGITTYKQILGVFNFKHPLRIVIFTIFSMFTVGSSIRGTVHAALILNLILAILAIVPAVIYTIVITKQTEQDSNFMDSEDVYGINALKKIRATKIESNLIFKICGCICCILMLFASISLYNMPNSFSLFIDIIKKATGSYGKYTLESGTWHIWILGSLILGIIINMKAVLGHNYHAALNYISLILSIAAIITISIATKGDRNVMAVVWVAILALGSIIFFALVKDKDEEVDELDDALNGPIIPANAENPLL